MDEVRPVGRPTKYDPEYHNKQAVLLYSRGFTDDEVAELFGIDRSTLYRWKTDYPEFCDVTKVEKNFVDDIVENKLYERAIGYRHNAVKIFQYEGAPLEVPYVEHYPPDTQAIRLWLMNRRRNDWKDKPDEDKTDAPTLNIVIKNGLDNSNIEIHENIDNK